MNGMKVAKPDVPTVLLWKIQFFWDWWCVVGCVQCVVREISNDRSAFFVRVKQSKKRTSWTQWLCTWRHLDTSKFWELHIAITQHYVCEESNVLRERLSNYLFFNVNEKTVE